MTKEDIMWIAIRIFGLYFLVLAVAAAPSVAGLGYGVYYLAQLQEAPGMEKVVNSLVVMLKANFSDGVTGTVEFLFFSVFAYYFLRSGKRLHAVIMSSGKS